MMTTGDSIDAFIAVVALMVLFTPMLLVMFLVEWFLDRRSATPPRGGQRIPAREMELIGEDYRDCVADYFASFGGSDRKGTNHDGA